MTTVSVLFSRKRTLMSIAVRAFMWSRWAHVALIDGDTVIESAPGVGVRRLPLADALADTSLFAIVQLPCRDPQAAIAAAASQIGKGYDWGAIVGHLLRFDFSSRRRWVCSELVAWAIAEGGTRLFRSAPYRVSPQHLYMPRFNAGE